MKGDIMVEEAGTVTMQGAPLALTGTPVEVGQEAGDFTVVNGDMGEEKLSDYKGKLRIIITVPSLDTPVCDKEVRRFNQEAQQLSEDVVILTVSMDLPFAQSRWCGSAGIDRVKLLSDYRQGQMGMNFGVLIKDLRLLARAIFIVDKQGKVVYKQIVKEITNEPDYEAVLAAIREQI
jgi:thiol peroxidase